jgi:predicted Zn-dependent protease
VVGKDRALEILESALRACDGDQAEVLLQTHDEGFTRYANSAVTQSSVETDARTVIKVIRGRKVGLAATNSLTKDSLREAARWASANAKLSQDNPDFVSLPGPRPLTPVESYSESTAQAGPVYRADNVLKVIRTAAKSGFQAAGVCSTHVVETAVANSLGVRAYQAQTRAHLTCIVTSPEGSGYAETVARDVGQVNASEVAEEAAARCALNCDQLALEPGEYTVVLEPYAVAEMIGYLVYLGFHARSYQDGQSFLCGNLGRQMASPDLTLWDDGLDPAGLPSSFDLEGQPKSRVVLIDKGVASGLAYDSASAFKEGRQSTGHYGGCGNLFIEEGVVSREELIAGTERGILVTRFHYVRPVHPQKTIITGMTRDGTFLVERGKVTRAIMNMRFTQSILEALARIEFSRERKILGGGLIPAMRLQKFLFVASAGH